MPIKSVGKDREDDNTEKIKINSCTTFRNKNRKTTHNLDHRSNFMIDVEVSE